MYMNDLSLCKFRLVGSFSNNGDGLVVRVVAVSPVIRSGNFLSATEGK